MASDGAIRQRMRDNADGYMHLLIDLFIALIAFLSDHGNHFLFYLRDSRNILLFLFI